MVARWYWILLALILALGLGAGRALAGEGCSTCGAEPNFPDAQTFLDAHGYPTQDYKVLLTWSERVHDGSGKFVTGFHVRSSQGGKTFDLYSDAAGNLLTKAQLKHLGIFQKRWNLAPMATKERVPPAISKVLPKRPIAVGPSNHLGASATVLVPPVDVNKALAEDAARKASGAKGPCRISLVKALDQSVSVVGAKTSQGTWQTLANGGYLWSLDIQSPGALGIRVHFAAISVPPGAQVILYNENDPVETVGPYTAPAKNMADLWSGTTFSDSVVVECYVPQGVDRTGVRITIDKVTHQYVPLDEVGWAKAVWVMPAGNCENDVSCYPDWATTATGVAGYDGVDSLGGFFCSGSLLADTVNSGTPYFLTANHCVSTAATAATMEIFWLYQTSSCNGPAPSVPPYATPVGATLLATTDVNSGTDFCLVRLNSTPPAGIAYLGWSSSATALGTSTACIHHPSADYKRISFGSVTEVNQDPSLPANRFYQNSWTSGVTEPGSSGSPLMIVSTHQVIGQLYGGPSYCGAPAQDLLDYYGRFDQSFPLIEAYLNPVGSLQVDLGPANAITAGAQWRVDGGAWQNSGATVTGLSVGQHTVSFMPISGWTEPANQSVTINYGQTTVTSGSYILVATSGQLTVTISPTDAVNVGAHWRVDGGAWQDSGATVTGLSAGQHTVSFMPISGWNTPADQPVTIQLGLTTTASATYTLNSATGSLQATINPANAVSAGAQWRVDGGAWQISGATVNGLAVGQHTVEFKPISAWNTPANQPVSVSQSVTTTTDATYTLFGDVNGDNVVDATDVQLVINAALGINISPLNANLDGVNGVNAVDVQLIINAALGIFS